MRHRTALTRVRFMFSENTTRAVISAKTAPELFAENFDILRVLGRDGSRSELSIATVGSNEGLVSKSNGTL